METIGKATHHRLKVSWLPSSQRQDFSLTRQLLERPFDLVVVTVRSERSETAVAADLLLQDTPEIHGGGAGATSPIFLTQ